MKSPRRALFIALLFAMFVGCGAPPRAVIVWHAYRGDEETALRTLAENFSKARGIRVSLLGLPHDSFASKLEATVPRGRGPHVFIDAHERIGSYLERNMVAPLEAEMAAEELGQFDDASIAAVTVNGHVYGVPLADKCLAMFVNESVTKEDITSWDDLTRLRATLPPNTFPLAYEVESAYAHAPFVHAFGGRLLGPDGTFVPNVDAAIASMQFARKLEQDRIVPEEASGALVKELFVSGRTATAISGPWFLAELPPGLAFRVIPIPPIANVGNVEPLLTVEAAFLAPHAVNDNDAKAFIHYLASKESAEIRTRVAHQIVPWRGDLEGGDTGSPADRALAAFRLAARNAIAVPSSNRMRSAWLPFERALRSVLRGEDATAAMRIAKERFDDATRPPPPPPSPTPLVLVVSLALSALAYRAWRRAQLGGASLASRLRASLPAYAYVAHAVILILVLVLVPLAVGAAASFYVGERGSMHYAGFENYILLVTARGGGLLSRGSFYFTLLVTLLWTVVNVVLHLVLGIVLGMLLARPWLKVRAPYRVLLILPWAVPSYVTALAWKGMFHRQFGAINAILMALGMEPISFFSKFATAFAANVSTNVWLGFPFMMVSTLSALAAIPKEVLEAALVDGATPWQRFRRITWPMLLPGLMPAIVFGTVWTFNMFNVVFLVSGGEPDGTTDILVSDAYRWAFTRGAQYGYAAAYSVAIVILLYAGTRLLDRVAERMSKGRA